MLLKILPQMRPVAAGMVPRITGWKEERVTQPVQYCARGSKQRYLLVYNLDQKPLTMFPGEKQKCVKKKDPPGCNKKERERNLNLN